jgi:hypothetical protein
MKRSILFIALFASTGLVHAASWTYQGTLNDNGKPAEGVYDLRLTLLNANGTRAVAAPVTLFDVAVSKGSFATDVDFGVDLSHAHGLKLSTEVQQGNSGFASIGEPKAFDPNAIQGGVCWSTDGNLGVSSALVGTLANTDDELLRLTARGQSILYLRGSTKGVEQNLSTAVGNGSAAWISSSASGPNSFTVGTGVTTAAASNSFVYADGTAGSFTSNAPNQFMVRADGGVRFNTTASFGSGDDLVIGARPVGGDADADLVWRTRAGKFGRIYLSESDGRLVLAAFDASGTRYLDTNANGAYLSVGGTWTNGSSREFKQGIVAIDSMDVLDKVTALPISIWRYKNSAEGNHVGPMAEDFKAAFGLGNDAQHIATVDADGVALAAIQGLNQKLEAENAALKARLDALEARIDRR